MKAIILDRYPDSITLVIYLDFKYNSIQKLCYTNIVVFFFSKKKKKHIRKNNNKKTAYPSTIKTLFHMYYEKMFNFLVSLCCYTGALATTD